MPGWRPRRTSPARRTLVAPTTSACARWPHDRQRNFSWMGRFSLALCPIRGRGPLTPSYGWRIPCPGPDADLPDRQQEWPDRNAAWARVGLVTDDIAAGSPASDVPSSADGYVGDPAVQAEWDRRYADRRAAVERPAQRRARGRGRRAHARAGARRRLRRGRGRRLARARRLGRDRARGLGRGAGAGGRARAGRRRHRSLGARRAGRGGAPAGVLRPGLRAVPGPAAHPRRRGRAGAARGRRARRRAAARAPRGDGHPARRTTAASTRPTTSGRRWSPRCSTTTGRSRWTSSGHGSRPTAAPARTTPTTWCCARADCAEKSAARIRDQARASWCRSAEQPISTAPPLRPPCPAPRPAVGDLSEAL